MKKDLLTIVQYGLFGMAMVVVINYPKEIGVTLSLAFAVCILNFFKEK